MAKAGKTPPSATTRRASYQDILDAPDHLVAEIVDGVLHTHPRPAPLHAYSYTKLGGKLENLLGAGNGGAGGWLILLEPELHLGGDVLVPDLAGWRSARMPAPPDTAYFTVAPDWICEILSPSTRALDLGGKREIYAREGVAHLWFVDPEARTLEAFELRDGQWILRQTATGEAIVSPPPFNAAPFKLGELWWSSKGPAKDKPSQPPVVHEPRPGTRTKTATSRRANYQDVLEAPEHLVAEIVDGVLHTHPRPMLVHSHAQTGLVAGLRHFGRGGGDGAGGWLILIEPELHLGRDIVVPDIAGWRVERMPREAAYATVAPDWVCEILSPSTRALDLGGKREIYAREGVAHLWFVDPEARTLEAFELRDGQWVLLETATDEATVSPPPFSAFPFKLGELWWPGKDKPSQPPAVHEPRPQAHFPATRGESAA